MLVDGRAIRDEVLGELSDMLASRTARPRLGILSVGHDPVSARFVTQKEKMGESLGVMVEHIMLAEDSSEEGVLAAIESLHANSDGVIVQLPLPTALNRERICDAIAKEKDIDMLSSAARAAYERGDSPILPPVVGAIDRILVQHQIGIEGKRVVIVGRGQLVGKPAVTYFRRNGGDVMVCDKDDTIESYTCEADIIVLGAGSPALLTPDMIREGVIVLDAGTSESEGKLVGDADPACADVAALLTPVPGGIGPITVAMLYKNLVLLSA